MSPLPQNTHTFYKKNQDISNFKIKNNSFLLSMARLVNYKVYFNDNFQVIWSR